MRRAAKRHFTRWSQPQPFWRRHCPAQQFVLLIVQHQQMPARTGAHVLQMGAQAGNPFAPQHGSRHVQHHGIHGMLLFDGGGTLHAVPEPEDRAHSEHRADLRQPQNEKQFPEQASHAQALMN